MYASRASLDRIVVPRGGGASHRPVAEQTIGGHVITELCGDAPRRMIILDAPSAAARSELAFKAIAAEVCLNYRVSAGYFFAPSRGKQERCSIVSEHCIGSGKVTVPNVPRP